MKDSNAASSNSPKPTPPARSEKTAAPKAKVSAKAKAVARAKARPQSKSRRSKAANRDSAAPKAEVIAAKAKHIEAANGKGAPSENLEGEALAQAPQIKVSAASQANASAANTEQPTPNQALTAPPQRGENKVAKQETSSSKEKQASHSKATEPVTVTSEIAAPEIAAVKVSSPAPVQSAVSKKVESKVTAPVTVPNKEAGAKAVAPAKVASAPVESKSGATKAAKPASGANKGVAAAVASQAVVSKSKPVARAKSATQAPTNQAARHVAPKAGASPAAATKRAAARGKSGNASRGRTWPKLRAFHIVGIVAMVGLTGVAGAAVGSYNSWAKSQTIAPKVRVGGEPIGGMTREQAVARLNERFGKVAFTLQTDDKKVVMGLADVGGKLSIEPTVEKAFAIGRSDNLVDNFSRVFGSEVKPRAFMLPIEWNRGALTARLQIVNDQYEQPAVDARLVTVSGATPRVTGERYGRGMNVSATADAIQKAYFLGLPKVEAVTEPTAPKVRAADLDGRDVKLGEWRTNYNGGIVGRTTNIKVACRALDGQVFMPGEVLSFNELTGERTYSKGYRMAHIFMREKGQSESQVVDGLAGGVCQVSSTLYNAVRLINQESAGKPLEIVERSSHSLPVTYVAPGRDATVAWPSRDFKFRNTHDFPIYVRTASGNGRLTISIWGRVPYNQTTPVSLEN